MRSGPQSRERTKEITHSQIKHKWNRNKSRHQSIHSSRNNISTSSSAAMFFSGGHLDSPLPSKCWLKIHQIQQGKRNPLFLTYQIDLIKWDAPRRPIRAELMKKTRKIPMKTCLVSIAPLVGAIILILFSVAHFISFRFSTSIIFH